MRSTISVIAGLLATATLVPAAWAGAPATRMQARAGVLQPKLNPGDHHPDFTGLHSPATQDAIRNGLAGGTLATLPNWSASFSVAGMNYSYTLIGTDPAQGPARTVIPTIIVPVRLTIPDYIVNGQPLVLDGTRTMSSVLNSPIFHVSNYDSGKHLQFTDAMLHAEFPNAPADWHLRLSPSVAPTIDVSTMPGETDIYMAKTGKYAAVINDGSLDRAIAKYLHHNFEPSAYVIFITYNAVEGAAFGYHSALLNKAKTGLEVFAYASWLEGVGDVLGMSQPNADTLAHEAAGTVHDPFGTSITAVWGDWFNHNECLSNLIEVGAAVENAPAKTRNTPQTVVIDGKKQTFIVQSEALLPYFTRQTPSNAIHQAYSWPNEKAITGPAPLFCGKKQ